LHDSINDSGDNLDNDVNGVNGIRAGSHYEEIRHPNMMSDVSDSLNEDKEDTKNKYGVEKSLRNYDKRKKKDCRFYFAKLDYEILRPLLIYKYEREEMHRQDEYIDLIVRDQNLLQSVYGKIDHSNFRKASMGGSHVEEEQVNRVSHVVQQLAMSAI